MDLSLLVDGLKPRTQGCLTPKEEDSHNGANVCTKAQVVPKRPPQPQSSANVQKTHSQPIFPATPPQQEQFPAKFDPSTLLPPTSSLLSAPAAPMVSREALLSEARPDSGGPSLALAQSPAPLVLQPPHSALPAMNLSPPAPRHRQGADLTPPMPYNATFSVKYAYHGHHPLPDAHFGPGHGMPGAGLNPLGALISPPTAQSLQLPPNSAPLHLTGKQNQIPKPVHPPPVTAYHCNPGFPFPGFPNTHAAPVSAGSPGGTIPGMSVILHAPPASAPPVSQIPVRYGSPPARSLSKASPHKDLSDYISVMEVKSSKNSNTRTRQFACQHCGRCFFRKSDLVRHIQIHLGIKPNVCELCGKQFIQKSALTVHRRVHTGEKPYQCKICNRAFSDSSSLARHRRIHARESSVLRNSKFGTSGEAEIKNSTDKLLTPEVPDDIPISE